MNEQRVSWCGWGIQKEETPVFVCHAKKEEKKKILIAITPPSIQTGTCYHSALLLEATSEKLLLPLTSLPFFHMNSCQTSLFLKKIRNKEGGNEFYCLIFPPSAYWQAHQPEALWLLLSHYLRRGRENEFYSPWSYLFPSCLLSEEAHSLTLLLSHYLTQRFEMNFTVPALSFLPSTVLWSLLQIACIVFSLCSLK